MPDPQPIAPPERRLPTTEELPAAIAGMEPAVPAPPPYETPPTGADAAAGVAAPPTPTPPADDIPTPPIEDIFSETILGLVRSAPRNPMLRGMIRSEQNLILPRTLCDTGSSDDMLAYMLHHWRDTRAGGDIVRYHQQRREEAARDRAARERRPAATPTDTTALTTRLDDNGNLIVANVTIAARERGRANYVARVTAIGSPRVPAAVVQQARAARDVAVISRWIADHRADAGLEEYTEDYEYTEFRPEATELQSIDLNLTELARVLGIIR